MEEEYSGSTMEEREKYSGSLMELRRTADAPLSLPCSWCPLARSCTLKPTCCSASRKQGQLIQHGR